MTGSSPRVGRLLLLLAMISIFSLGCSCEKTPPQTDDAALPAPLRIDEPLEDFGVEFHLSLGTTQALPIVIVFAEGRKMCLQAEKVLKSKAHILCSSLQSSAIEGKMKKALRLLKERFPDYIGKAPVFLVADPHRSEAAWRLILAEPGFFGHSYLEGLEPAALTSTTLAALLAGKAQTLILRGKDSKRLKFLKNMAKRRGLSLHVLEGGEGSRRKALELLRNSDPRLAGEESPEP